MKSYKKDNVAPDFFFVHFRHIYRRNRAQKDGARVKRLRAPFKGNDPTTRHQRKVTLSVTRIQAAAVDLLPPIARLMPRDSAPIDKT